MVSIGTVSYTLAAVSSLALLLYVLRLRGGELWQTPLPAAVAVTGAWAVLAAALIAFGGVGLGTAFWILESTRQIGWLVVLLWTLRPVLDGTRLTRSRARLMRWGPVGLLTLMSVTDLAPLLTGGVPLRIFSMPLGMGLHMLAAVAGLVLVEQLIRNLRSDSRWSVKHLCLGLGGMFAYDLFLYSDALLMGVLNPTVWSARGLIFLVVTPLLAVSISRRVSWARDLMISRSLVLHTAALVGAGLYLLTMSVAGYYISRFGGSWGTVVQTFFLFGAALLLAVILFSAQARASLRVVLSKHLFRLKYDYRHEWLRFIATLSSSEAPPAERVIMGLARIMDSPAGALFVPDEEGCYRVMGTWNQPGLVDRELAGDGPLISFMGQSGWVVDIREYRRSPDLYEGLELPAWLTDADSAWLAVPLLRENSLEGVVVLTEPLAPRQINWEDRDLLKTAGQQLASYVALMRASEALSRSRQFEAFNRLTAYLVHDLKNVVAQLSLVVSNAPRHRDKAEFLDDAFDTVDNAVTKMNRVLAALRQGGSHPLQQPRDQDLAEVLRAAARRRAGSLPVPQVLQGEDPLIVRADAERLGAVLEHLLQNAQEATSDLGSVTVHARREGDDAVVEIRDSGVGMDEQFIRERLFRPFDTTKGNAGMGIGAYESREFVRAAGGRLLVNSKPGRGSTFRIELPLVPGSREMPPRELEVAS